MDCCLVKTVLLFASCATIFACPQHHHHHHQPPQVNAMENLDVSKDYEMLSENKQIYITRIEKVIAEAENETATAAQLVDDEILSENKHTYKRDMEEVTVEDENETAADAEVADAAYLNYTKEDLTEDENSTKKEIVCICGLFSKKSPIPSDAPLMYKTFHNISCDEQIRGKDVCTRVCLDFATSHVKDREDVMCSVIKNSVDLTGYLYARHCDINIWAYTGLETPKPICCKDSKPVMCEGTTAALE